jgi:hypothetical protein
MREGKRVKPMIHILFGQSQSGTLNRVLKNSGVQNKEHIISFREIFSVGPIRRLQDETGAEERFAWLAQHMNNEFNELSDDKQGFQLALDQLQSIPGGVPITIWIADNAHEQTGLCFVLHLLKNRDHAITLINTTKVYEEGFRNAKYIIRHTGEIATEQLQEIYEQGKQETPIPKLEREMYEEQWNRISGNHDLLRIWQNNKIESVSIDHYDRYIILLAKQLQSECEPEEFMKSARLIGEVIGHLEQYIGDDFLEYRVRILVGKGMFEMEGKFGAMRFYSIRIKLEG